MVKDIEKQLDDLTPRELGLLIEHAGDKLHNHDKETESMKSLEDMSAEVGHRVVAIDGQRVDY